MTGYNLRRPVRFESIDRERSNLVRPHDRFCHDDPRGYRSHIGCLRNTYPTYLSPCPIAAGNTSFIHTHHELPN